MPHERPRSLSHRIQKAAQFWPVVGLLGPRQSGKTTLLTKLIHVPHCISLDDLESKNEANKSPKTFLAKAEKPLVIDEAQKAPPLFDAIKFDVDRLKIPGTYYLTGSSAFSSKLDIRESLTGRIGLFELHPMTLAELERKPWNPGGFNLHPKTRLRFSSEDFLQRMASGGMPIPAFMRSHAEQKLYWDSWLETTVYRDLSKFMPRSYDADFAYSILNRMTKVMLEGEMPTLKHFLQPARKVRQYLDAMCEVFMTRKFSCHETGVGKEIWYVFDSGLLAHLMGTIKGEEATLALSRHFLMNEISALHGFLGQRFGRQYFKTARSDLVDFIIDGVPFKVVASVSELTQRRAWQERPLLSAMRHLKSSRGYLIGPTEKIEIPPKGVGILPLSIFS